MLPVVPKSGAGPSAAPSKVGLVLLRSRLFRFLALFLTFLALLGGLSAVELGKPDPLSDPADFPGITLHLTAEAGNALQQAGQAFPAADAGFSAYYRVSSNGGYSLDKAAVDAEIFAPVTSGDLTYRDGLATMIATGGNYTVARLPIINIDYVSATDKLTTTVHVYYDDQGWIVAYLPANTPSAQIWQARTLDAENPSLADVSHTVLLDAINVIYVDGLNKTTPLTAAATGLDYYHWQHPDAANFLMLAVARGEQGGANYPVSFAVPATFQIAEVSAAMWISRDVNPTAPCAKLTLDAADLIAQKCVKGFYHATADLTAFNAQSAHVLKLEQTGRDEGASGGLLMLVYGIP